tara:strand:- start:497 stop:2137 length:1641 start_codon:yes stop_codon:yes gene_type:complete
MGTTLSLNYRKPKKMYKKSDEVTICVRYYFKDRGKPQYLNLSTGVKVKLKDWDEDWDKQKKINPIKRGDKDYNQKNSEISQFKENIDKIERDILREGEIPYPSMIKSKLRGKKVRKRRETYKEVHFLYMFRLYEDWCKENMKPEYRKTILTQVKYIKEYCEDYQEKHNLVLLVSDIDEEFIRKFVMWCYNNQNLQPSMLNKRMRGFTNFRNWSNRIHKTNYVINIPRGLVKEGKSEIIYLTRDEVKKLYDWKDFDYDNNNHIKYLKKKGYEMEHITDERVGIKDEVKRFKQYTNFEVMKDMLVFLCSTGMRFGDMLNIRVDNFRYYKDDKGKEDRSKGMWEFRMEKVPRKGIVKVPSNIISFNIYKKYSSGKKRENFLFPRTRYGNPISNQKFNKHIKKVCELIGINDLVEKPKFTIDGKVVDGTDTRIEKHNVISSHIGRRSFIREQIELGKHQREIMFQTGHTSLKVFNGYYDVKPSDLWKSGNEMYFGFNLTEVKETKKVTPKKKSMDLNEMDNKLEQLKVWFEQDKIDEEEYKTLRKKILNL